MNPVSLMLILPRQDTVPVSCDQAPFRVCEMRYGGLKKYATQLLRCIRCRICGYCAGMSMPAIHGNDLQCLENDNRCKK
jgi:hypothetical protein